MTTRTAKRGAVATTALAAALALTACGAAGGTPSGTHTRGDSPTHSRAPVDGFEVGEPFGQARWSIAVAGRTRVDVRDDRVIVDETTAADDRTITAYDTDGKKVWSHDVAGEHAEHAPVRVLDETVAVVEDVETEGSGLDRDETAQRLTLLSDEDGSTVARAEGATVDDSGVIVLGEGRALTEDGEKVDHDPGDRNTFPDSTNIRGVPLAPELRDDLVGADLLAVDHGLGLAVLRIDSGAAADTHRYYGVDDDSGDVAYDFDCPGYTHTDGGDDVAIASPNGRYAVHESIRFSADGAACFGGGDQKRIEFTAVDDNGTAYGTTKENMGVGEELVVVPRDGEPETFDAPVPVGVLDGGLAVHIDGRATNGNDDRTVHTNATTITGNPIR